MLQRLLLCASLSLLSALTARAQIGSPQDPIVISTAPFTITQSGYYILGRNLSYDPGDNNPHNIITVNASNVTLDFNGFFIAGPVGNTSQQVSGVRADERANVTIKNGTIAFCAEGIRINGNNTQASNCIGARVENMRVTFCYSFGIGFFNALGNRTKDCLVSKIGGNTRSTVFCGGIQQFGGSGIVADCDVSDVTGSMAFPATGTGISGPGIAMRNTVSRANTGFSGKKIKDNVTLNVTTAFQGCIDAGGNN